MVTSRNLGRWALYSLGGLCALVLLLRGGLGVYLNTAGGRAMVARKVSAQIGMPVEITQVRVGLFTSNVGLRVFDPAAADSGNAEVLSVQSADADVSVFGLAAGRVAPTRVELRGVNLTLHVSAEGSVLTTLPKVPEGGSEGRALPTIALTDGRVTVRQNGRPEFALEHLNVSVEPNGGRVKLSGTVDDPQWSKWSISGDAARAGKSGTVEFATADAPLTMDRLGSIPFVPATVWAHVKANGRGAVSLRLWIDTAGAVRYAVDIKPRGAALALPDAGATVDNVTGSIKVEGSKLTLSDTRAGLAGGTITLDGSWDWASEPSVARVKVTADKLDIKQLPPEWKLPRDFEGKLKGRADLTLRVFADGRIEPEGGGEGAITDVKILDFPADDIPIRLRKTGKQYEFQRPKSTGRAPVPHEPRAARVSLPLRGEVGETTRSGRGTRAAAESTASVRLDEDSAVSPASRRNTEDALGALAAVGDVQFTRAVTVFTAQEKKDPRSKADGPPTLDATLRLRDIDIAELLVKLSVKLDYKIGGKVTAEAAVSVPVAGVASDSQYKFTGKLSSAALVLEGLTIRDLTANMTYQNGTFTLSELSGKIAQPGGAKLSPGTFKGTLVAQRAPPGDVIADLTIDAIPVGEVLKALPDFKLDVRGTVAGKVSAKVPFAKLSEPAAWAASGEVTSSELVVEGRGAKDVRLSATVAKGELTAKGARVTLEGIPIRADATLGLSGKYPFSATVRTTGTEVTDLRKLVPEANLSAAVEGVLETETNVKGTASPLGFTATGTIKATKLTLAKSSANHIAVKWELTQDKLVVSELRAEVFGGSVSGSADVPFSADKGGKFEVNFKTLDANAATELVPDFPVKIGGKVSGRVAGTLAPDKPGRSRVGNIDVSISAPKLTVQGIPAEKLTGKVAVRNAVLEYDLEGKTLGGTFEINGRYPGQKGDIAPKDGKPLRGSFRLRGADLSRLSADVGFQSLAPLGGRLDVTFDFENDFSSGVGTARLRGLRWGDAQVAQELTGALVLKDGVLRLSEFAGRVAGGELRARMQVRLRDTSRNFFTFALSGADSKALLAPLADSAALVTGPVTLVANGRLGRETSGSGTLTMARGTVSKVPVTDLSVPFRFATAPGGYGEVSVRDAAVSAGSGRARADLTMNWGTETRIDGKVRFTDVPLKAISPELGENALLGNGTLTGRFDIGGSNVRSANDLTGALVATLNNTSVKEIPILKQITPFVNPSGLVKPFKSGDVRANLANGVFRVQRLALANPTAQLFAEGTLALSGRVDLSVVAHTGTIGPETAAARLFGLKLPAVGPVPITLVRDLSDFLSNRTIRLTVTGSTSDPIVRVNVGALLSEQAVRFLLNRYVVPAEAAGALGLSSGFGSMSPRK